MVGNDQGTHTIRYVQLYQWPFQEPKLEVPTICKGLCKGIYPQNMALYGTVPPF